MPTDVPHPHHHHPASHSHPPAVIALSLLRMALAERLAAVAILIAVIWGVVLWAMY